MLFVQRIELGVLSDRGAALGITIGNTYSMDIFHAERHTSASNFQMETTIDCFIVLCPRAPDRSLYERAEAPPMNARRAAEPAFGDARPCVLGTLPHRADLKDFYNLEIPRRRHNPFQYAVSSQIRDDDRRKRSEHKHRRLRESTLVLLGCARG